jgi:hypothetical protein
MRAFCCAHCDVDTHEEEGYVLAESSDEEDDDDEIARYKKGRAIAVAADHVKGNGDSQMVMLRYA